MQTIALSNLFICPTTTNLTTQCRVNKERKVGAVTPVPTGTTETAVTRANAVTAIKRLNAVTDVTMANAKTVVNKAAADTAFTS